MPDEPLKFVPATKSVASTGLANARRLAGKISLTGEILVRIASLVFVAILLIASSALALDESPSSDYAVPKGFTPRIGAMFPDFELLRDSGETASLSHFSGSVVVLNFYTTHCGPCHRDVPALNEFQEKNPAIRLVSVTPDDEALVKQFQAKRGLRGVVLMNSQRYLDEWGVMYFPSFAIIGSDGRLLAATYGNRLGGEDGTVTAAGLEKWVKTVVEET